MKAETGRSPVLPDVTNRGLKRQVKLFSLGGFSMSKNFHELCQDSLFRQDVMKAAVALNRLEDWDVRITDWTYQDGGIEVEVQDRKTLHKSWLIFRS